MGLDIYVYKTTLNENSDIKAVYENGKAISQEAFKNAYNRAIKALTKVSADEYGKKYVSTLKKLSKLFNFPQYDLEKIGVAYDYENGITYNVKPLDIFEGSFNSIVRDMGWKYDGYFRKAYFIMDYFRDKLIDDCFAFASVEDINGLLDYCDERIEKNRKFKKDFGEYLDDEWDYEKFVSCKKQFTKILNSLKDNETIFIEFNY